eukprot:1116470-Amorphochlora_amoeboformis.AAC.1
MYIFTHTHPDSHITTSPRPPWGLQRSWELGCTPPEWQPQFDPRPGPGPGGVYQLEGASRNYQPEDVDAYLWEDTNLKDVDR